MSNFDWRSLKKHRENIMRAEIGALLHDWKKCMDWAIVKDWNRNPTLTAKQQQWQQRKTQVNSIVGELSSLLEAIKLTVGSENADLKTLADKGSNPSHAKQDPSPLVRLLGSCHGIAHSERGLDSQTEQLEANSDRISNAFGNEYFEPDNLLSKLNDSIRSYLESPQTLVSARWSILRSLASVFSLAWGDTRRPINEVTLWDWSYAVASLYKCELARHLVTKEPWREEQALRWRLLRLNFNALDLYSHAIKIADLLAYKKAVDDACERVKSLLEDEYPMANELYRDTTGIYFIFPDLALPADLQQEIRRLVEEVEPELAPRIEVGCGKGARPSEQLKRLLADQHSKARKELAVPVDRDNFSTCWTALWENLPDGSWEVCPVCRLRPKREGEEVCCCCDERRELRFATWKAKPEKTIWLDELADGNGRLALIVGKFGLDDWLSGDLVQTMLVKAIAGEPDQCVPKNPSPARLRRVWETCQKFWDTSVCSGVLSKVGEHKRWVLTPKDHESLKKLLEDKVCDGKLNGNPISVTLMKDQLLTISYMKDKPDAGKLHVTWGSGKEKGTAEFDITEVGEPVEDVKGFQKYLPTLTLLTSPDQFMALVPASNAVDLAEKIRAAYAREFGKVQNRLPLFLGLIFFQRKTPLMAVMDTARQMLDQVEFTEEHWCVSGIQGDCISFKNGYSWCVPQKMGDETTPDDWYPYFFIEGDASACERQFSLADVQTSELVNQKYKDRWLVHASELAKTPRVIVTPSRFAYMFLDHAGQRFEFNRDRDVMFLDELPRLVTMWQGVRQTDQMTDTKLRGVASLLQEKAESWGLGSTEFKHLTETALKEAGLWNHQGGVVMLEDVVSRRFERCLEIYLRVLKQRVKEMKDDEQDAVAV